jgi:hypothetical protein
MLRHHPVIEEKPGFSGSRALGNSVYLMHIQCTHSEMGLPNKTCHFCIRPRIVGDADAAMKLFAPYLMTAVARYQAIGRCCQSNHPLQTASE